MRYDLVHIFLDEAGDLGFQNPRSTKHLLIAAMATPCPQAFTRLTKRAHRRLRQRGKGSFEFKFNNSSDDLRWYFLDEVAKTDSWIVWGAVEKANAGQSYRLEADRLYNYVCGRVLADMFRATHARAIQLIVDRWSNKWSYRGSLNRHVEDILQTSHAGFFKPELRISHFDSRRSEGLQVNDFVVGAIFQMVERGIETYYEMISTKVLSGQVYW